MENPAGALRYAIRQFAAAPIFTAAAVLTLALGIGGTTAIFTLIHAVMLRSLPVADPAALYRIGDGDDCCVEGGPQDRWGMFSYPLVERLRAETPEFEQVTAFQAGGARLSVRRQGVDSAAQPLRSEYVSGNYFQTLGVGAFGGRVLTAEDDRPDSTPVVVLSHHVWDTLYGGDASVVGSTFVIEGHPFSVIGVAPPGFFGETLRGNPPDLWIPLNQEPLISGGGSLLRQPVSAWLRVIGRLRPGASIDGMAARLTGVLRDWMQHDSGYPANWMADVVRLLPKQTIAVVPAGAGVGVMKEQYSRTLQILLGVCALVLLIACANVANLLLARSVARRTQTAIRLAIGATRGQIVRQALVESVLLAIGGGVAGLLVAAGAARLLLSLAFTNVQFLPISTQPSPLVLAFATALALVTGILFGAVPAWLATRTDPVEALRGSGRSTSDHSSFARTALLIVQATLSVVLVAGATMLARSLAKIEHQDFGYQVQDRVVVSLNRPPATYTQPKLAALYRSIEDRLTQLPGVQGAGLALYNPLTDNWGELILVAGHPMPKLGEQAGASWDRVSANYLQNFGVGARARAALHRRRQRDDRAGGGRQRDVREALLSRRRGSARSAFRSRPARERQHLPHRRRRPRREVRGVRPGQPGAADVLCAAGPERRLRDDLMKRIELQSHFVGGMMLVTRQAPGTLDPVLRRVLAEIDPNLTITSVRTMEEQVALSFNQERALAGLAGLFGIVALLLAAIGLYGVTAYTVAQRTNEIGIRMALGADRQKVMALVLRGAFSRVAIGLLIGLPLAVGAGRLIAAQLYGVSFWDPVALSVAAGSLAICGLVAALLPARRAASISPIRALRTE